MEQTTSWLSGYRRLTHRYERNSRNYLAFRRHLRQRESLVTQHQRRTLGIPRPIQEMISRWISLLPPPKVKITAER